MWIREVQLKKPVNLLLTTPMFHKNQNQTTEDAPFVSHTACIKQTQYLLFFKKLSHFIKISTFFEIWKCPFLLNAIDSWYSNWNLKQNLSVKILGDINIYIYILNRKKTSGIIPKSWEQKVSCAINFGVFHYTVSVFGIPTFRKHSTMTKIQSNQNILHELIFPYFFLFFFRFPAVINM